MGDGGFRFGNRRPNAFSTLAGKIRENYTLPDA